jgi:hypothetical protein
MAKRKSKKKRTKRVQIEFTYASMCLWGCFLFFLLGWIFVLGILVGRGLLPGPITAITGLKGQTSKLPGVAGRNKSNDSKSQEKPDPDPKLVFYEKLSVKKEEAKKKDLPDRKKRGLVKKLNINEQFTSPPVNAVHYTIQLASLKDKNMAQRLIKQLISRGYPAYLHQAKVKGTIYYRIRCGRFSSIDEADDLTGKIASETGLNGFVSRIE